MRTMKLPAGNSRDVGSVSFFFLGVFGFFFLGFLRFSGKATVKDEWREKFDRVVFAVPAAIRSAARGANHRPASISGRASCVGLVTERFDFR